MQQEFDWTLVRFEIYLHTISRSRLGGGSPDMDNLLNVPIHLSFSGKPAFPRLRQDLDSIAAMAFLQYRQMFQPGLYLAGFEGPSHQERGSK